MRDIYYQLLEDTRLTSEDVDKAGYDSHICSHCAKYVKDLYPKNTKIIGFVVWDNPSSILYGNTDGHDFALIDDRYIVDIWAVDVESASEKKILDLRNLMDQEEIDRLYGDKSSWLEYKNNQWVSYLLA